MILIYFLVSFIITVAITPPLITLIKKIGLLDDPKLHKHPAAIHKKPVPRGGGIALFLGIFLTSIFFLPIDKFTIALFLSSFLALLIGVLDDKMDISPYIRFLTNILSAIIIVVYGANIPFITNPISGGILHLDSLSITIFNSSLIINLSTIAAVVWIVWIMNMLNWSKGVDGQMPGIVAISAFVIGIVSLRFPALDTHSIVAARLPFIIAGGALGFLIFNFYPAKIFPGYGATSIYLLLSVIAILPNAKLATAVLVMAVPMVDGIFTFVRRILSKRSPFWHDKKHLHHLLLEVGFGQRKIALFYWIVSAIFGIVSLTLSSRGKLFAILTIAILILGGLFFLHKALKFKNEK